MSLSIIPYPVPKFRIHLLQIEITVTKFYFAFPKRGIQSYRPDRKIDCVVSYVLKNTMVAYKRRDSKEPCIFMKLQKLQLL
jgi:hypothetical protein